MNEKDLKRFLEEELDRIAPEMSAKVERAPIAASSRETSAKPRRKTGRRTRVTVTISAIAAALVIAVVLAVVVPPMFDPVPERGGDGFLLMNINPDVEILFDKDGKVTSVKAGNADADVLLADESFRASLVGENVDAAAAAVAERALEMGYIDGDASSPDAVGLTVVGGDGVAKIGAAVRAAFVELGAACVVVAKTADKAWLAERFDVAEGELTDMLAEVKASADAYFERIAQKTDSVEELTEEYAASVAGLLKNKLRMLAGEARAVQALLAKLEEVNAEIEKLASDMTDLPFGLLAPSDIWGADDFLSEHPEFVMSPDLSAAVERAHALLAELAEYDCEPKNKIEAWAFSEAVGKFVELCDEYGDRVLGLIDQTNQDISDAIDKVEDLYQEAKNIVLGLLGDVSDALPGIMTDFETALDNIAEFAADIDSASDFVAKTNELIAAASDVRFDLGETMDSLRDKLTAAEYADVESALIEEYGSLEAWYESLE